MENLKKNLDNPDYVIVDLRPDEAYNGWKIDEISRGGHIKNAVQFPAAWLNKVRDNEIVNLLEEKGIKKDKNVVLYHSKKEAIDKMAQKLLSLGYDKVYKFEGKLGTVLDLKSISIRNTFFIREPSK
ncbi:rhodanese-like domain-containing protein [Thermosyntropha sp.]|uniref:rhodanese-like domain-containing protein n=1 Tax=Thermosyntropha sp. TaxID=2740820 RepID=UPI0025E06628|nr:rhodanese-like domain-containing protein [Thermosyntropha sp.]MBO8158991.1 hypothetical protein [Thermosyntropha sp.]